MLIHLGGGVAVPKERIVLIADMENGLSRDTARIKERLEKAGGLIRIGREPSTLVLCQEKGREVMYLTSIGLRSLIKRWRNSEYRGKEVLL